MSLNCDARISPHSRTCGAGTTRIRTPPTLSQRYVCARNTRSVRSLRVAPKVQSYGGYISDAAYVYDTGPVFTGIRCTCIGEERMRMKGGQLGSMPIDRRSRLGPTEGRCRPRCNGLSRAYAANRLGLPTSPRSPHASIRPEASLASSALRRDNAASC